jgi:hypothetical protein
MPSQEGGRGSARVGVGLPEAKREATPALVRPVVGRVRPRALLGLRAADADPPLRQSRLRTTRITRSGHASASLPADL